MISSSVASHRAFMVLTVTLSVLLTLAMVAGWRWHFGKKAFRQRLLDMEAGQTEWRSGNERAETSALIRETMPVPRQETEPMPVPVPAPVSEGRMVSASRPSKISLLGAAPDEPDAGGLETDRLEGLPREPEIKTLELLDGSAELNEARVALEGYWSALSWRDRVAFVWDGERVGPLMKRFYEDEKGEDPERGDLINKGRFMIDKTEILYFSFAGARPLGSLDLALRRHPGGGWKLDWESFVGLGEMSWSAFKKIRPTEPKLMRAFVKLGDYHNYEFADPEKYVSLHLYDESGAAVAYAFCERATPLGAFLQKDFGHNSALMKSYTVRVAFPAAAESDHCVWLREVVASRWLLHE